MLILKKAIYLIVFIGFSAANAGSYDDFFAALERDATPDVQALLARGFDPNSVNPKGEYALVAALRLNAFGVAQLLIAQTATQVDVRTAKDETPLMLAALKGQLAVCTQLIARDADVNKTGWTPLHYAASGGKTEVVNLLLQHYAYIDAESPNGTTPLMMAAGYGAADTVKALLAAGADPTLKNALGLTALDFARGKNKPDAIELLSAAMLRKGSAGSW